MAKGNVKWYNQKKGFGFITGEDKKEYFVHYTALAEGTFIRDGDEVSFDPREGEKGPVAKNVVLLRKASEIDGAANTDTEDSESYSDAA